METLNHEYYTSLEVNKMLKEAGFDWEVNTCRYNSSPDKVSNNGRLAFNFNGYAFQNNAISAPTLDIAQRWLREVHHLHITIFSSSQESWMFRITKQHQSLEEGVYGEDFYTYEEAQEAGIKKALELILEKGE